MHRQITLFLLTLIVISGCSPKQPDQQELSLTAEPSEIAETGEASPLPTITRDPFMQATADALQTQWATTPTATSPNPSAWPEPTPLTDLPPLIDPSHAILPEHALMRQGLGVILDSALSPDGSLLALGMSTGWFVYRVPEFVQELRQPTEYPVQSIKWSPDGSLVLTGYDSYAAPTLWTADGQHVRELEGFYSGGWSPDGTMIAVPYLDRENPATGRAFYTGMKLFDGPTGEYLRDLKAEVDRDEYATGYEVIWSPDSRRVALGQGFWGDFYHIWDAVGGSWITTIWSADYDTVSFSPDGTLIGIKWGVEGSNLGLFDLDTDTLINKIALPQDSYYVYEWTSDRRILYAYEGNNPGTTYVIDIDSGQLIGNVPIELTSSASYGSQVAYYGYDGVYIVSDKGLIGSFQAANWYFRNFYSLVKAHWLSDQRLIVAHKNAIYMITNTGVVESSFSTLVETNEIRWTDEGLQILESPATCSIYFDNDCFGDLIEWIISSNSLLKTGEQATADAFSSELSGSYFNESSRVDAPITSHSAFLNNGGSSNFDLKITRADGSKFSVDYPSFLDPHSGGFASGFLGMMWSPDGERLLILFGTGADADGPFYVVSSALFGGAVAVADVESGTTAYTERYPQGITVAAWSPNSQIVAAGMASTDYYYFGGMVNSEIVLIDAATGKELIHLTGHSGGINGLAWSPDGTMLASISNDGTMIVWDVSAVSP